MDPRRKAVDFAPCTDHIKIWEGFFSAASTKDAEPVQARIMRKMIVISRHRPQGMCAFISLIIQ
jgi:hypothetical protein